MIFFIPLVRLKCDQCRAVKQPQYHLTMSDATLRSFCTYQCVLTFQGKFNKPSLLLENSSGAANIPVPTGLPKRVKKCEYQAKIYDLIFFFTRLKKMAWENRTQSVNVFQLKNHFNKTTLTFQSLRDTKFNTLKIYYRFTFLCKTLCFSES